MDETDGGGSRVDQAVEPPRRSPSGLITQYLAWRGTGSRSLFVGQQWLGAGQRVFRHTHPVEEVLLFLAGSGVATLGEREVPVGAGITLVVPAGVEHGFRNDSDGPDPLHILVIFPGDEFARTDLVEPFEDQSALAPAAIPGFPADWLRTSDIGGMGS